MKQQRDTPRLTMTDEEMVKDYPRLAREYALLHQDYREAIRKPLNIPIVSNRRELLIDFFRKVSKVRLDDKGNMHTVTKMVDEYLKDN